MTLHPVAPAPTVTSNCAAPTSGSLLHGILTKSQSPRPTTFSPTLARLLTAPERERAAPTMTPNAHHLGAHLLHGYQGANPVSISDFLSSSKVASDSSRFFRIFLIDCLHLRCLTNLPFRFQARTEITITPVINTPVQNHNNLIHIVS